MVADLSKSSLSITIFSFFTKADKNIHLVLYKFHASNLKKRKKWNNGCFYRHKGIFWMSFKSKPVFSHPYV